MKNAIILFSSLVFMGLGSCAFQTSRVQHEQPDDVYWKGSNGQDKIKTLDDVKFEKQPAVLPKQPKQLQESTVLDEAVGDESNDEARAEAAYQAWNQQRLANNQVNNGNSDSKVVQEIQSLPPQNSTDQTTQTYSINNYNNNFYNNSGLRRNGFGFRSRWFNSPDYFYGNDGAFLGWNTYSGWNGFSGWQFGYQWPLFNQPWISPFCTMPLAGFWGYNSFYPNFGFNNIWCNPYYTNYYGFGFGFGNQWGGYNWPWHRTAEINNNPSRSRPRETMGGAGKDQPDANGRMNAPGSKPFLGKNENEANNESGRMNQPAVAVPSRNTIPTVSTPIQSKPYEKPVRPAEQPNDIGRLGGNSIPQVNTPVNAGPNRFTGKTFRLDEPVPDGGKLIPGENGPVYVPPRDHVAQPLPERNFQTENPSRQPDRGYVPSRNQSVQQIQTPSPRNEFPSRSQERIEYQAPAPPRNSSGGFSNGSRSGSGSSNSGSRPSAPISRPR